MKKVILLLIVAIVFLTSTAFSESEINTLIKGDTGDAVHELQERLCKEGYLLEEFITDTYDDMTELAVLAYQADHSLEPNGIADEDTLNMLFQINASDNSESEDNVSDDKSYLETSVNDEDGYLYYVDEDDDDDDGDDSSVYVNTGVYYSTNSKATVKDGNKGVYAYSSIGTSVENYYIIDFDAGYVYSFSYGNGDGSCDRIRIQSGDLNSVLIITWHDGADVWSYGLHFSWKNQPDHLIIQDNDGFEWDYYPADLKQALAIKQSLTIHDY